MPKKHEPKKKRKKRIKIAHTFKSSKERGMAKEYKNLEKKYNIFHTFAQS
jgi:hypothetical protein